MKTLFIFTLSLWLTIINQEKFTLCVDRRENDVKMNRHERRKAQKLNRRKV